MKTKDTSRGLQIPRFGTSGWHIRWNGVVVDYTLPEGATKARVKISNILGTTVATCDLQGKETQRVIDLRGLASGIYTYTVYCGNYSQTGKLVIVK